VFQPQSNKKKKERGKGKRRKKEEKKEEKEEKGGEKKGKEFISLFLISKSSGELTSLWPNGEDTVAAVRTSMRRRMGTFLNIVGRLLPSFVALA
jgi:hypothetical protein